MYSSKSDYILQKSCCCVYKNEKKSPIKEISNPMPLDSIFWNHNEGNDAQTKFNTTRKPPKEYNMPMNTSTFPRTTRNELPQIPGDKHDNIDLLMNQVKSSFYQEIVDSEKSKKERQRIMHKTMNDDNKKDIDLIYITSRILIGFCKQSCGDENTKVIRSLKQHYKKNLKIFCLNIRSTIENESKTSLNTVTSLPHLMPFLDDIYNLLVLVTGWLHRSTKNVILLNCFEKTNHLCALCVRFILIMEDMNKRLLRIEKLILSDHEINALQFYEKSNLEKYHTPSLKRYASTVTNIMLDIVQYQPNLKQLHFVVLKNIHSSDQCYEGIKSTHDNTEQFGFLGHKMRTIYLTVYQNFHLVHTSYKITLNEKIETNRIIFVIEPLIPLNGDILIMANVTNFSGFQSIYFRFQFHTCLLHGDLVSFKNSELDLINNKHFQSRTIGLVELHLKNHPNMIRDHENMLLSNKYIVVKERGTQHKDIFNQIRLLDQTDSGDVLSYTAGPVDGSLYTAIPKATKTPRNSPKYEIPASAKTKVKCQTLDSNTPAILKKFNNLEKDLTDAAELISTPNTLKTQMLNDHKVSRINVHYNKSNVELRGSSVKAIRNHRRAFTPYRKSNSLSNNELPIKIDRDDRHYFLSYANQLSKMSTLKVPGSPNGVIDVENASPYDNVFPHNNTQQICTNTRDLSYNLPSRMHESNYELVSPTNDIESHNEFVSNLNVQRSNIDEDESLSISQARHYDELNNNNIVSTKKIYDNTTGDSSTDMYKILTSRNLWFKPNFSRQDAILYLLEKPVGCFIIRTSTSLSKSLSIVLKCSTSIMNRDLIENDSLDHIRHFIIDFNTEGYKIRGFNNEKYYPDLARLICDHLDKTIGLPCPLVLPCADLDSGDSLPKENYACQDRYMTVIAVSSVANNYNVIYLGSFITKNLCDITAISASVDTLQERVCKISNDYTGTALTKMSLKIINDRIIFTDLNRKMFFRKHCKLEDILCCEVDPKRRVWSNVTNLVNSSLIPSFSPIFGVVSCLSQNTDFGNQTCCQLFLALGYDAEDICSAINQFKRNMFK